MKIGRALLITLALLFAGSTLLPLKAQAFNVWAISKSGIEAQEKGNYKQAIELLKQAAAYFAERDEYVNAAIHYGRIGLSYASLEQFDAAAEYWDLEAGMWRRTGKTEQEAIAAERKAQYVRSDVRLFTDVVADPGAYPSHYHNAKYEPVNGVLLGAYAENDPAVHDAFDRGKFYSDRFPELVGKNHAGYMIYLTYGMPLSHYSTHIAKARQAGTILQIALQPLDGLDAVKDDSYLRQLARDARDAEVPIFLRFANEMNEASLPWYGNPKLYIEKFRLVADVFHEEAPNVVMSWAPNWFPMNTIAQYYPGDDYVDWVGISLYKIPTPELDPLGKNVDRESYVEKLAHIVSLYGDRKPIYIAEGAVSYTHIRTGQDVTAWAAKQIEQFYAYLPLLYPEVKGFFWFSANDVRPELNINRSFALSANPAILAAYQKAIQQPYYLSAVGEEAPRRYSNILEYGLPAGKQQLHAYVKTADPNVAKVVYKLNGATIGSAMNAPWTISYDFGPYKDQDVKITVEAYNPAGKLLTVKEHTVYVGTVKPLNHYVHSRIVLNIGQTMDIASPEYWGIHRSVKLVASSSDAGIASVSPAGILAAEAPGKAVVTVKSGNNRFSLTVKTTVIVRDPADKLAVRIPGFAVHVNGTRIDSASSRYPLLVYKGVTYFPMTWNYSKALGLATKWSAEDGFGVSRADAAGTTGSAGSAGEIQYEQGSQNDLSQTYYAELPTFDIRVNGKLIDNDTEPYPALVFRNITYFPMTWDYAVGEFGLRTGWNAQTGFSVASKKG